MRTEYLLFEIAMIGKIVELGKRYGLRASDLEAASIGGKEGGGYEIELASGTPNNQDTFKKLDKMLAALGLDIQSDQFTISGEAEEIEDKLDAALAKAPKARAR